MITGDDGGYGTIGNAAGGGMHYIHDLFDGSRAPTTTHPLSFVAGTDNYVYYSEFSQNTDQAVLDAPVDFEWNYMHNSRCDKSTNAACVHTDGGPEVYGDACQPDASTRSSSRTTTSRACATAAVVRPTSPRTAAGRCATSGS